MNNNWPEKWVMNTLFKGVFKYANLSQSNFNI